MTTLAEAPETDGNSTPRATPSFDDLLHRAEAEYREMPGLSLTARQAERLWGLDCATCSRR